MFFDTQFVNEIFYIVATEPTADESSLNAVIGYFSRLDTPGKLTCKQVNSFLSDSRNKCYAVAIDGYGNFQKAEVGPILIGDDFFLRTHPDNITSNNLRSLPTINEFLQWPRPLRLHYIHLLFPHLQHYAAPSHPPSAPPQR